jgi:hypothetical protein
MTAVNTKTGYRWALADATAAAEQLINMMGDVCERIEIAGSIRRKKNSVKDIELVAIPKTVEREILAVAGQLDLFGNMIGGKAASVEMVSLLDQRIDELIAKKQVYRVRPNTGDKGVWGMRQKKLWIKWGLNGKTGYIPVDLFIVRPPAQWGAIFTLRTGPGEFSQALMGYINTMTDYKQVAGRLVRKDDESEVQTPKERDYFKVIGLRWMPPEKRTAEALRNQVRFSRAQEQRRKEEQRDKRMVTLAQDAILGVFKRGILYFPLDMLKEKIADPDMNILKKALQLMVDDGRVVHVGGDLYASPEWDGVIADKSAPKDGSEWILSEKTPCPECVESATVADLALTPRSPIPQGEGEKGEAGPVGGEQLSAPPVDKDEHILSTRIRRELERLPGAHCTVLIPRLGCDRAAFRAALWTLKDLGMVRENRYGGLWLVKGV